jgi:hypothetical protein
MKHLAIVLGLVLGLGMGGCDRDPTESARSPIRLSGSLKLVADSISVTLSVKNTSDTTQVLEWTDCPVWHPTNFAIYRDVGLTELLWEVRRLGRDCPLPGGEAELSPDESMFIRGASFAVPAILGDSIPGRTYYVAIQPLGLTIRPKGGSYPMPVHAIVPAGTVDLRR